MLTHKLKLLLLSLIACFMCSACGAAPASSTNEQSVASQSEALTPVVVEMWADHLMAPPLPGEKLFRINEDPTHPTPNLIILQVTQSAGLPDVYSVQFRTAHGTISAADWNTMSSYINVSHLFGAWTKVRITYDNSAVGDQKPWTPPGIQFFLCNGVGLSFGPNCG
ncbi:MAG: hypothetical protein V4567_05305 [Pseudomonadota bacterium]